VNYAANNPKKKTQTASKEKKKVMQSKLEAYVMTTWDEDGTRTEVIGTGVGKPKSDEATAPRYSSSKSRAATMAGS
jgi:hypothetical protein